MGRKLYLRLLASVLFAAISSIVYARSLAAPQLQTNLLTNPGFESSYASDGVGTGWLKWTVSGTPTFKQITSTTDTRRVSEGANAQQLEGANIAYSAGLQQGVNGLTIGKTYKFTVYGHAWASTGDDSSISTDTVNLRIGIAPGTTYAADPNITWSGVYTYTDTYSLMSVEIVATDTVATVFTWAEATAVRKHNDVYWDNASFVEVGAVAATEASSDSTVDATAQTEQATQDPSMLVAPTDFPMPTPDDTGKIIYYVKPNDNLVHIATIACGETIECLDKIRAMNPSLTGDIIYPGQKLVIGEVQNNGSTNVEAEISETPEPSDSTTADVQDADSADSVVEETTEGAENLEQDVETTGEAIESTPTPEETGAICVTLYSDLNGNGVLDSGETLVADGIFSLVDLNSGETVDTYNTDGSEPYCFSDLVTGTYRVVSSAPVGHTPTTRVDWDLTLATESTANLEFGAQFTGEDLETATVEPENTPLRPALMGAFGVMLLLSAAGIAGYMVVSRRR